MEQTRDYEKIATIGLIASIAGLLCCGVGGLAGIILAIIALNNNCKNKGKAIAAIIVGSITLLIWIVGLIAYNILKVG